MWGMLWTKLTVPSSGSMIQYLPSWDVPPLFRFLQDQGNVAEEEMRRVFNMGVGYCLIVRPAFTNAIVDRLSRLGETAWIIGTIEKGKGRVRE